MREHGTRACYVFGIEPGSDRSKGCRCEPCCEANRAYARHQRKRKSLEGLGRESGPWAAPYIDATEVREHLAWLSSVGIGRRTVAERTGIAVSAVRALAIGEATKCRRFTADKILAVGRSAARPGTYIDAGPTWKLLNDLIRAGHTKTSIAKALGSVSKYPELQVGRRQVTAETAAKVAALHHAWMWRTLEERRMEAERRASYRAKRAA